MLPLLRACISLLCFSFFLTNCAGGGAAADRQSSRLSVVTTTTMITDLVRAIGGDSVRVEGLMGSGVDPHLYKASEGDVSALATADLIIYNGLHLEGKLVDILDRLSKRTQTIAVGEIIAKDRLIPSALFDSNYDPHIWFEVDLWRQAAVAVHAKLIELVPEDKAELDERLSDYTTQLDELEQHIKTRVAELQPEQRILVTAHDAFSYFGQAYGFEVEGLQGLSTATEASVQDVNRVTSLLIDKKIPAIFVESSVPVRTVQALQESVQAQGGNVSIGGTLYSDALGSKSSNENTYITTFRYNVNTIVDALKVD